MPYDKTKPYACPCCGYWNGDMKYDYYKHKKPLIEDKKIRECVKLWTELNGYGHSLMYAEGNDWGNVWCSFYEPLDDEELLFRNRRCANLQDRKIYAITELCGNSKEEE